jgi:GTP1/Obg family GTP-binding protein
MMIDKLVLDISSDEDVKKINIEENSKINHLHLQIINEINSENFKFLLDKLSKIDAYNRFHVDLVKFNLTDDIIEQFSNCLKKWNLREFNLNISDSVISDTQFENFLKKCFPELKNLERLHLILENIEINSQKIKSITSTLENLPNLNHVFINIKRNKVQLEDMTLLNQALNKFYSREIHF